MYVSIIKKSNCCGQQEVADGLTQAMQPNQATTRHVLTTFAAVGGACFGSCASESNSWGCFAARETRPDACAAAFRLTSRAACEHWWSRTRASPSHQNAHIRKAGGTCLGSQPHASRCDPQCSMAPRSFDVTPGWLRSQTARSSHCSPRHSSGKQMERCTLRPRCRLLHSTCPNECTWWNI